MVRQLLAFSAFLTLLPLSSAHAQGACATTAPGLPTPSAAPSHAFLAIDLPCQFDNTCAVATHDEFGITLQKLDYDGDGEIDLAATAATQEIVYVLFGPWDPATAPHYASWIALTADCGALDASSCSAAGACVHATSCTGFGNALAAGDIDGDGDEELFISQPGGGTLAGRVWVFDDDVAGQQLGYVERAGSATWDFGADVAVGELDGVPGLDLAVGMQRFPNTPTSSCESCGSMNLTADQRGGVIVYAQVLQAGQQQLFLDNLQSGPSGSCNGNFGHRIVAADMNGDGLDELLVQAPGNGGACAGSTNAGQLLLYQAPLSAFAAPTATIEDPEQLSCASGDLGSRFGMHRAMIGTSGGSPVIAAGAPRKDLWDSQLQSRILDAGGAFFFTPSGVGLSAWTGVQLFQSSPSVRELVGYRPILVDFFGGASPDLLTTTHDEIGCNPRILLWDGDQLGTAGPATIWAPLDPSTGASLATANWAFGLEVAQLWPSAHEQIALGDPTWHPLYACSGSGGVNQGRILILHRIELVPE